MLGDRSKPILRLRKTGSTRDCEILAKVQGGLLYVSPHGDDATEAGDVAEEKIGR